MSIPKKILTIPKTMLKENGTQLQPANQEATTGTSIHLESLRMLEELDDYGFSRGDVAKMLKVSVATLKRYRETKEGITVIFSYRLRRLRDFCRNLEEGSTVNDVAAWFETPVIPDTPLTPVDLYCNVSFRKFLKFSEGRIRLEKMVAEVSPNWESKYSSEFELFNASDGNKSICYKV